MRSAGRGKGVQASTPLRFMHRPTWHWWNNPHTVEASYCGPRKSVATTHMDECVHPAACAGRVQGLPGVLLYAVQHGMPRVLPLCMTHGSGRKHTLMTAGQLTCVWVCVEWGSSIKPECVLVPLAAACRPLAQQGCSGSLCRGFNGCNLVWLQQRAMLRLLHYCSALCNMQSRDTPVGWVSGTSYRHLHDMGAQLNASTWRHSLLLVVGGVQTCDARSEADRRIV
jgi:hypothetical protein